jgi:hypothetical protein
MGGGRFTRRSRSREAPGVRAIRAYLAALEARGLPYERVEGEAVF